MKYIFITLFICTSFFTFCQNTKVIVKEMKETNFISKEVYAFPKIIITDNKIASNKINNSLLEFLQIEKKDIKKSIFENVWQPKNENCIWLYHDLGYKVLLSNDKLLSIDVWAEFGKHNITNIEHYLFDIKSGNRIKLDTLFATSCKKKFAELLYNKKDSIIQGYLKSLDDSLNYHQSLNDTSNIERDTDIKIGYNECLDSDSASEKNLEYVEFYFMKNKIYLSLEKCFCWAANALDELGRYYFEFTYEELKPYLSSYGKQILK